MKKSFSISNLFLLTMLLPPVSSSVCDSSYEKNIMGLIGLVGAAVGVYGIGSYCGLWDPQSDQDLIDVANKQLHNCGYYQPMFSVISSYGPSFDPKYSFDEPLLYQLALAKRANGSYDSFFSSLTSFMRRTRSIRTSLAERSFQIKECGDWQEMKSVGYAMDDLNNRLSVMLDSLTVLRTYLERHAGYFRLFEYEDYVRNRYYNELQLLDIHTDAYMIKEGIRACAIKVYHGPFALIQFIEELNKDIKAFQTVISRASYNYATRISYARDVAARLYHLERLTVSDNEYMRALLAYQQYQRERDYRIAGAY